MKVLQKNNKLMFDKISIGTVFTWGEHAYIKLAELVEDGGGRNCNAVDLESGELSKFEYCCEVTTYPDAALTI